jgi:hypothetical protein
MHPCLQFGSSYRGVPVFKKLLAKNFGYGISGVKLAKLLGLK